MAPIVDSIDYAIFVKTLDGTIVTWNPGAERLYGYTSEEIIGKHVSILFPPEGQQRPNRPFQDVIVNRQVIHFEAVRAKKDATCFAASVTISPIFNSQGLLLGASVVTRDITEQKRSEESIRYQATHDPLTDLANCRTLVEVFDGELRRSDRSRRPFVLLLLDLDDLKTINDRYGHLVGSRAICRVAAVLKHTCRSIDTPARYGGDEFAVILPECDRSAGLAVSRRITEQLSCDAESPLLTLSLGMAIYPENGCTFANLFAAAHRALYKTKLLHGMYMGS